MATKKIKRFQEGGMSDKDRGLEASKEDKVGFFERLRMGNIDDEGSEAYRRFGAGRGKATPVETMAEAPATRPTPAAQAAPDAAAMDEIKAANAREPIPVPAGPRAEQPEPGSRPRVNVQAAQPSRKKEMTVSEAKKQLKLGERPSSASVAKANAQLGMSGSDRNENYGNEGRGRALTKEQQFARADAEARSPEGVAKRKKQEAEQGLERVTPETAMLPGGSLKVLSAAAKKLASTGKGASGARTPAQQAFDRARMADRLTPARNAPVSTAAKTTAVGKKTSDYRSLAGSAREDAKANQAYDKLKKLSSRGAGKASSKKTKKFDDESNIEFKRGGSVSSASKRGDGIATRGKTNCKMR